MEKTIAYLDSITSTYTQNDAQDVNENKTLDEVLQDAYKKGIVVRK